MQLIPKVAAVLLLSVLCLPAAAQKIKLVDGDPAVLKDQKELNVEFTYDHLSVGKDSEEDYVQKKTAEYNKKEPGKGDTWAKAWVADRASRYEPKFDELFNDNGDIKAGSFPNAKYTLIFHTTFIEPGFNVGVARKNSYIDAEVLIVETANKGKTLAKISVDNAPGRMMGFDFDTGMRITESYAVAGKKLAKFLGK
ncbi:hypothetical protein FHW36_106249 [Chitinophaga polysaccharea]|uniref:Uncharacterized protein n=1 Tax=Chitinophaga polysaccharea TaxID=1293035 RepID=A0A561PLN7_9BACT|nr:hypothetical protein [Chitinophaga polysaccharea]TWF39025.1 hypothetical protein FHW36_106249 [Chitinophaga polysaccharea]